MLTLQQQEEIRQEEALLICDMRIKEDRELAEFLEETRLSLMVTNVTGSEYKRHGEKPVLYHSQSNYQGHDEIKRFIARRRLKKV